MLTARTMGRSTSRFSGSRLAFLAPLRTLARWDSFLAPDMYDEIAALYHLVYPDWNAAIAQQAAALDAIIRKHVGPPPRSILDVSCGIGTQALGLAALGHAVTASDLSSGAVERARREAGQRSLAIDFMVADMCRCAEVHGSGFDVVLSADNSIPHLLSDDAIREALGNFHRCIRPGGITILGVRDYLTEERSSPQLIPYGFRSDGDDRYFVVQTRDWDGDLYDVGMYFIREARGSKPATVTTGSSRYYAVPLNRLVSLLEASSFIEIQRLEGVLYQHQPLLVARRGMG